MGKGRRGRDRTVSCVSCGRNVPRTKAVEYKRGFKFSPEMGVESDKDVEIFSSYNVYYCISCAKHRKITQKKKERLMKRRGEGED